MKYYRQCTFKQKTKQTTAWIEERGAKVGVNVTFQDDSSGFWKVVAVGSLRMEEGRAKKFERAYLSHRKCSDI